MLLAARRRQGGPSRGARGAEARCWRVRPACGVRAAPPSQARARWRAAPATRF